MLLFSSPGQGPAVTPAVAVNPKIPTESIGRRETGDNILNILDRERWTQINGYGLFSDKPSKKESKIFYV